ncbi:MAG: translesion error-prone DNA polymerase V autoproteolytic subunit [Bacteroidota bacterium]|nr:translesion error-prone DNA polymerase V autoproteolytic subunit [Bacteroidota bacterium]MEC7814479.1 translesion error-prone DNA polymerase V autoproteolytic subunit [Bacteroidota bacterium]MEC7998807.1 translesion error-prone DNA polymerase V autoproteolytic subunit [Bacteroidota bacterium]MEC8031435.1 translesion error-prone DNA polymerase V autoproteolytic subunit [Bacteroidota bacterium]MEC8286289.1 translesion error-prone DNA polymerase V autoproteolytic subunit [Bacteroidota bacterium
MGKLKNIHKSQHLSFYSLDADALAIPFYQSNVPAGFPSPAEDFMDLDLNLQAYLVQHPSATFCVRVTGDSMQNAGIFSGDVMVVDRALEPKNNTIVLAVLDGEFTVKRIQKKGSQLFLKPENETFKPIEITEEIDFKVWGVVTHIIHKV